VGYGAVAAAHRKQESSRAHATTITLPLKVRSADPGRDDRPELRIERDLQEPLVERLAPRGQPVARGEVVDQRQLGVLMLEGLRRQPLTVDLRPRGPVPHAAVTQQQLREPMPAAHQVQADLFARPGEIPGRLERS
jgi:hypothetical protein